MRDNDNADGVVAFVTDGTAGEGENNCDVLFNCDPE